MGVVLRVYEESGNRVANVNVGRIPGTGQITIAGKEVAWGRR